MAARRRSSLLPDLGGDRVELLGDRRAGVQDRGAERERVGRDVEAGVGEALRRRRGHSIACSGPMFGSSIRIWIRQRSPLSSSRRSAWSSWSSAGAAERSWISFSLAAYSFVVGGSGESFVGRGICFL